MNQLTALRQHVENHYQQPTHLPQSLRLEIEQRWGGERISLYALADLDTEQQFKKCWVAMGPTQIAWAIETDGRTKPVIHSFARNRVNKSRVKKGLTASDWTLIGDESEEALARFRYTHRQQLSMGALQFVIQRNLEGTPTVEKMDPDQVYAENVTKPITSYQSNGSANSLGVMKRILSYVRPYRKEVAAMIIAAVISALGALILPLLTGHLIDEVLRGFETGALQSDKAWSLAKMALGGLFGGFVLVQVAHWIRLKNMALVGEFITTDVRRDAYNSLQEQSLGYFSKRQTGKLISRITADCDRLWGFVDVVMVEMILAFVTFIAVATALFIKDAQLAALVMLPVPFIVFAISRFHKTITRAFSQGFHKNSKITAVLADVIPGIRVVQAFDQKERERGRFLKTSIESRDSFMAAHKIWTTFVPALILAIEMVTVAVWFFALPRILVTDPSITVGTFVSFIMLLGLFFQPMHTLTRFARQFAEAITSAQRVFEIIDSEPEIVEKENAVQLNPLRGDIKFENVTFGYDSIRRILHGVSFHVKPGEMIGLVGESGGGKSTIINLMVRFYDALEGNILIDGKPIKDLDLGQYRKQVGMVLQDPFLFHGTIRDNIAYGAEDATALDIVKAAKAANAHDFICKFSHGYDTVIGERGQNLSGGERQRISIARAVLHDPKVLILDEATSAVDTETERKIQDALDRLAEGRTTIAIAHRLSTLQKANRLFVIKGGQLVEEGTHNELLTKKEGVYTRLSQLQQELNTVET